MLCFDFNYWLYMMHLLSASYRITSHHNRCLSSRTALVVFIRAVSPPIQAMSKSASSQVCIRAPGVYDHINLCVCNGECEDIYLLCKSISIRIIITVHTD